MQEINTIKPSQISSTSNNQLIPSSELQIKDPSLIKEDYNQSKIQSVNPKNSSTLFFQSDKTPLSEVPRVISGETAVSTSLPQENKTENGDEDNDDNSGFLLDDDEYEDNEGFCKNYRNTYDNEENEDDLKIFQGCNKEEKNEGDQNQCETNQLKEKSENKNKIISSNNNFYETNRNIECNKPDSNINSIIDEKTINITSNDTNINNNIINKSNIKDLNNISNNIAFNSNIKLKNNENQYDNNFSFVINNDASLNNSIISSNDYSLVSPNQFFTEECFIQNQNNYNYDINYNIENTNANPYTNINSLYTMNNLNNQSIISNEDEINNSTVKEILDSIEDNDDLHYNQKNKQRMKTYNNSRYNKFNAPQQMKKCKINQFMSLDPNILTSDFQNSELYKNLKNNLLALAKDQQSSRFLQSLIYRNPMIGTVYLYQEILNLINELMIDQFGNYLIQILLKKLSQYQLFEILNKISDNFLQISVNFYGTRALQMFITCIRTNELMIYLIKLICMNISQIINDINASHIVIQILSIRNIKFSLPIYKKINQNIHIIADHRHGCCILKKIFENDFHNTKFIIQNIVNNSFLFLKEQYGNYVIQFLLGVNDSNIRSTIMDTIIQNFQFLASMKYSSTTIEKCLQFGDEKMRKGIYNEIIKEDVVKQLINDQYGNYVVQKSIDCCKDENFRNKMFTILASMADCYGKGNYSKQAYAKLCKKYKVFDDMINKN